MTQGKHVNIDDWNGWAQVAFMMLLSAWGGFVSYLRMLMKGQKFNWLSFTSHLASSAFAGFITALLCTEYSMSIQWTGIACAISGHMGAEAIKIFEAKFRDRIDV